MLTNIKNAAEGKTPGTFKSMFEELDINGPWIIDEYGIMDPESFVKLRRIISTHQLKRFIARKEELLNERLKAHKEGNENKYVSLI